MCDPPTNDWHYINIRQSQNGSENIFTWKNKANVEWDLIFVEEESTYDFKFEVRKLFQFDETMNMLFDSGGGRLSLQQ